MVKGKREKKIMKRFIILILLIFLTLPAFLKVGWASADFGKSEP